MDHFSSKQIEHGTFVNSAIVLPEVGSTNTYAKQLIRTGNVELPAVIIAQKQTAGRGRENKSWWSGTGSLCFTLIINGQDRVGITPIATAIAVCESVRSRFGQLQPKIKWPNDVLLGGKKLCGILVESVISQQSAIVIGIGINTNCSIADADENMQQIATSLLDQTGQKIDQQTYLIELLTMLNSWTSDRPMKGIIDTFMGYSQFETGQSICVESSRYGTVIGKFDGIGLKGELILSVNGEPCVIESVTGVAGI